MDFIRIQNFRCLKDTGEVSLKPLTLSVGGNGTGKSTFSRIFPLLRQSMEASPKGPLLFYGKYVDFGEFSDVLTRDGDGDSVIITFGLKYVHEKSEYFMRASGALSYLPDRFQIKAKIEIGQAAQGKHPLVRGVELEFCGHKVNLRIHANHWLEKMIVNDTDLTSEYAHVYTADDGRMTPTFYETEVKDGKTNITDSLSGYRGRKFLKLPEDVEKNLYQIARRYEHGNTSDTTILSFFKSLGCRPKEDFMSLLKNSSFATPSWKRLVKSRPKYRVDKDLNTIRDILVSSVVFDLLDQVSNMITASSKAVSYVAPLRATAERYYRKQNLSVDQVDFRGENLPMYINNLQARDKISLNSWLIKNFNFKVVAKESSGHLELCITLSDSDQVYNLADMGFGYSQVLPIIVQLWSHINKVKNSFSLRNSTVLFYVIEQPELHLHPKMQSALADAFCGAIEIARANDIDLRMIIETHSEAIVNRLGSNVAKGKVSEKDINILVFEKKSANSNTEVSVSSYDENGYLKNWPYGFFEAQD